MKKLIILLCAAQTLLAQVQLGKNVQLGGAAGGGSVNSFSAGNLDVLFTTTVTNPTSTPNLIFSPVSVGQDNVLIGPDSGTGAPTFRLLTPAAVASALSIPPMIGGTVPAGANFNALTLINSSPQFIVTATGTGGATWALQSVGNTPVGSCPIGSFLLKLGGTNKVCISGSSATFVDPVIAPSLTASGLTSGNCVQAGTAGLLTDSGSPCGGGTPAQTSIEPTATCIADQAQPLFNYFDFNSPLPLCIDSGSNVQGVLNFVAAAGSPQIIQKQIWVPSSFSSLEFAFKFYSDSTTGNVIWNTQTACVADGDNPANPTFGSAVSSTTNVPGTAGTLVTSALITATVSCSAGSQLAYQISRSTSDTSTGSAYLLSVERVIQ